MQFKNFYQRHSPLISLSSLNSFTFMILNQINLFQPVDYMRSPSKQVINRDIKTSMNLLLRNDTAKLSLTAGQEERRKISGGTEDICKELQLLGWRFRTSLPILKPALLILHSLRSSPVRSAVKAGMQQPYEREKKTASNASECKTMQDFVRMHPELAPYEVQVQLEQVQLRLPDAGSLPLGQIIYLLKEMMIGYDALIDIFGLFQPSDEMVAISSTHQWRVWLNEDYLLNCRPNKEANISERQFIYKLLFLAEKHCTCTSLSKAFFNELKEFTYNKECSFIRVLEKVKEFVSANKIYQPNRVTLKSEKNVSDSVEIEKKKSWLASNNSSFNNLSPERRRISGGIPPKNGFFQFQSKSSSNILGMGNCSLNTSVTMPFMAAHRVSMNMSNDLPKNSQMIPKNGFIFSSVKFPRPNQTSFLKASESFKQIPSHCSIPRVNFMKPLSPPPKIQTTYTPNLFMSKSRHQLKALVNPKKQASPEQKPEEKKVKKARKYSQQLIKVKSLEALTSKKFAGSNIYMNDPQNRGTVNVIKANQQKVACKGTDNSSKKLLSPNYSSPSTGEMKDSKQSSKKEHQKREENYLSLKMNDLGNNKSRFNQSSYYGVGHTNEKANKNMAGSYSFYNKEKSSSQSERNEDKEEKGSNQWTKKISGLFSDDASIKHLKGSVKFKTADEERFEKQYLKDVKLDMLQKFGRPVRHSIVDQQDDFDSPLLKNPYKSMQLIEQVLDDGKSHIQKQQQDDQSMFRQVRKRNQTVQIITNIQQAFEHARSNKKQCYSDFQSDQQSFQQFGFESQPYSINIRK